MPVGDTTKARTASKELERTDGTALAILTRLNQLNVSATVSAGPQARMVFFTPKRSGWGQVVMLFAVKPEGAWILKDVRVLSLTSKKE